MSPFWLKVPPVMATVPVAFTVVAPVPLLKVPPLWTFIVPVLRLAAPMVVAPVVVIVSAELAPVMVVVPVLAINIGATDKLVPVTAAPFWMLRVPLVPAPVLSTIIVPNVPVLPLV